MLFDRLTDYKNPSSFGSRLRAKRAVHIMSLIDSAYSQKGTCQILDVGGRALYWSAISREWLLERKVKITLINIEEVKIDPNDSLIMNSLSGDACNLDQFTDDSFDLVHSNSVIEHVGLWSNMKRMADEISRVGRSYYVQTPNFWFPIEPHYFFPFIHWLPFPIRVSLAMRRSMGNWVRAKSVGEAVYAQQAAMLLDGKMLRALFPDAALRRERFLGITKSLIAVRDGQRILRP